MGASVHCEISAVTDHKMKDDGKCLKKVRSIFSKLGKRPRFEFDRGVPSPPKFSPEEIYGTLPADRSKPYDMYQVLARIVDDSELDEYKADIGKTLITGYARVDGWAVGIVANQRSVVKTAKG